MHKTDHSISSVRQQGFTLIEVMVALVIFSMIAIGAFRVLSQLNQSQAMLEQESHRLENLQQTLILTQQDISQLVPSAPAIFSKQKPEGPWSFTRIGWHNPLQEPRNTLASVRYSLKNRQLLREEGSPAASPREKLFSHYLSDEVEHVGIDFYINDPDQKKARVPEAIEFSATFSSFGKVDQLIPMVKTP